MDIRIFQRKATDYQRISVKYLHTISKIMFSIVFINKRISIQFLFTVTINPNSSTYLPLQLQRAQILGSERVCYSLYSFKNK